LYLWISYPPHAGRRPASVERHYAAAVFGSRYMKCP
jgi:hypothetical protein